jgi:hypothetical protein
MITQDYLKECFLYEQELGILIWRERPVEHFKNQHRQRIFNSKYAAKKAGVINTAGYWVVGLNGKLFLGHRLIWIYHFGAEPEVIDHINHNRSDNRLENLREVSRALNSRNMNREVKAESGHFGVYRNAQNECWDASIQLNGKKKHLGSFKEKEAAIRARKAMEEKLNYHANHGKAKLKELEQESKE